jgi:hypothetical protein
MRFVGILSSDLIMIFIFSLNFTISYFDSFKVLLIILEIELTQADIENISSLEHLFDYIAP